MYDMINHSTDKLKVLRSNWKTKKALATVSLQHCRYIISVNAKTKTNTNTKTKTKTKKSLATVSI